MHIELMLRMFEYLCFLLEQGQTHLLNIYAHNLKIKPFLAQFKKMVEMKPDAFIMADP
jgi:collagenase-like PrtC family protease